MVSSIKVYSHIKMDSSITIIHLLQLDLRRYSLITVDDPLIKVALYKDQFKHKGLFTYKDRFGHKDGFEQ